MQLDKNTISYLGTVATLAKSLGIEDIEVNANIIRGMSPDRTVFILQTDELPDFDFGTIGLTRVDQFLNRLKIISDDPSCTVDFSGDPFVKSLTMKKKGTKIDFKCANPAIIVAPKGHKDDMKFAIDIKEHSIKMLRQSFSTMKAETFTLQGDENGVFFKMVDVNNDTIKHDISDTVTPLTKGNPVEFSFKYTTKLLITLFEYDNGSTFYIGEYGTLNIKIDELNVFVTPRIT